MPIKMKTWDDLTAAQREHVVKLANEAGIPMPNVTTAVFHTRGDFISGAAWQFMKAWGGWCGPQADVFAIVAARTEDEARIIITKQHGDIQTAPLDELFVVAGETEPRILKTLPA